MKMNLFGSMEISSAALTAERYRAEVAAANLANTETTRTPGGGPYRRQQVVFRADLVPGRSPSGNRDLPMVQVAEVVADPTPPLRRYEPGHPDADQQGYVSYPAINPVTEMADLMGAVRAYELNASAVTAAKQMIVQALEILR
jgi:flagellar basal-body rod protein FlgC